MLAVFHSGRRCLGLRQELLSTSSPTRKPKPKKQISNAMQAVLFFISPTVRDGFEAEINALSVLWRSEKLSAPESRICRKQFRSEIGRREEIMSIQLNKDEDVWRIKIGASCLLPLVVFRPETGQSNKQRILPTTRMVAWKRGGFGNGRNHYSASPTELPLDQCQEQLHSCSRGCKTKGIPELPRIVASS